MNWSSMMMLQRVDIPLATCCQAIAAIVIIYMLSTYHIPALRNVNFSPTLENK